jgi:hypothetical protein
MDDFNSIIKVAQQSNNIDISISQLALLSRYSSFDCDIGFYPYNRKLSAQDFRFLPYEEYVNDVTSGRRSLYAQITNTGDKLFGILLSVIILVVFALLNPAELYSLQSVIAVIGAYAIGKEIWGDIAQFLIKFTKRLPLKFKDRKHYYNLEAPDTLAKFFNFARQKRYHSGAALPDQLDLILPSNSKEAELRFRSSKLKDLTTEDLHLMTIQVDPHVVELLKTGYFLAIGLSLNQTWLGFTKEQEVFQTMTNGELGVPDSKGNWHAGAILLRKSYSFTGRLKFYGQDILLSNQEVITK